MLSWLMVTQVALSGVLIVSAVTKWLNPAPVLEALRATGVARERSVSRILLIVEVGLALALILSDGVPLRITFMTVGVLLLAFSIWITSILWRKIDTGCACFGAAPRPVTRLTILRNLALILVVVLGLILSTHSRPLITSQRLPQMTTLVGLVMIEVCVITLWTVRKELRLSRATRHAEPVPLLLAPEQSKGS
jgi:hypothetical protein